MAKSAGEGLGVANLHWFIGDARRSIVLECRTDGMRVFHDDVDVLTNQPGFDWHLENLRNYITTTVDDPAPATWGRATLAPFGAGAGTRGIAGDAYPPSRFVKAAFVNANYPQKDTEEENVTRLLQDAFQRRHGRGHGAHGRRQIREDRLHGRLLHAHAALLLVDLR